MTDWEAWLRRSAEPPSKNEDEKRQRTEDQIRAALDAYEPLQQRRYIIYAKGSYANNTNVRLDYDVDIAVEYRGFFYSDLCFELEGASDADVGIVASSDPYSRADFKSDIRAALIAAFGSTAIEDGRVAYRVREKKTTLPADVVPSWEYRRYDRIVNGIPQYHEGARIYPTSGGYKNNFPKRQLTNGRAKNTRTGLRYKRLVRALKKLKVIWRAPETSAMNCRRTWSSHLSTTSMTSTLATTLTWTICARCSPRSSTRRFPTAVVTTGSTSTG